jgi:hypothetical protein
VRSETGRVRTLEHPLLAALAITGPQAAIPA